MASAVLSPPVALQSDVHTLLEQWLQEVSNRESSHRNSARKRRYPAWMLGILSAVLNAAVGVSFFIAWQQNVDAIGKTGQIWIMAITFGAAVVSALLTSLKLSERSERHLAIADQCHSLRTEITYYLTCPPAPSDLKTVLESLRDRVAALGVDD